MLHGRAPLKTRYPQMNKTVTNGIWKNDMKRAITCPSSAVTTLSALVESSGLDGWTLGGRLSGLSTNHHISQDAMQL